jgi:hypothetical protein
MIMGRGNGGRKNNTGKRQPNYKDHSDLSDTKQRKIEEKNS